MMDTAEENLTSSPPIIESSIAEVSSDGHSIGPSLECGKTNTGDGLSQKVPSVSEDQNVNAEVKPPHHQPLTLTVEDTPESSCTKDSKQNTNEGDEDEDMDSTSEISDFSDFSQESWHPVQGPIAWVQEQMRQGQNARSILEDLVPPGTMIPDDIDPVMLWRLIINIVSEPPKRKKLESINTLEDVISLMKSCNKIIVLTGAGVSVSCGIPDFRSRDGVYARLAVDFPNLPDPQAMFDIQFFRNDPRPFFKFAKEIYPGQFKPSLCHHFIRLIESQGKLLRNYTQNIDTLEQEAGIERVVQCHGSFATATCTNCKLKVKSDVVREDIFKQVIPKCPQCPEGTENAIMKPDIVFFGESLPEDFHKQMAQDKDECDLLIVIGSSLKVRPVALIPNSVPSTVPQILINRERLHYLNFDVELLGNCDDIVGELCHRLGSGWDQFAPSHVSPLTEVVMSSLPTPPSSPQSENPATCSSSSPTSLPTLTESSSSVEAKTEKSIDEAGGASEMPSASSATNTPTAFEEKKTDNGGDDKTCSAETEKAALSRVDCNGSDNEKESCTMSSRVQKDCVDNSTKPSSLPSSSSSSSQPIESVSSSDITAPRISSDKTEKEEQTTTTNALPDEVSTTTSTTNNPVHSQQEGSQVCDKHTESDVVSSTSNEHKKHHHHHSSHNHHHNHSHSHHNHHHKHHHHHHHQHPTTSRKSSSSEHQKNEHQNCEDAMEPLEKRPKLVDDNEASSSIATNGDDVELTAGPELTDGQNDIFDDDLEEMRKMWLGRKNRVSLAQRLAENQYLFLPPNRYVFKGAEVFSDSEEENDSDSDDDDDSDDNANENTEETTNDISAEAEELLENVEKEDTSSTKSPLPSATEATDDKDKAGIVSSTNDNGNEKPGDDASFDEKK